MFKVMHDNDNYDCEVNIASLFSPPSALSTPSTRVVEDDTGLYRARLILENQLYDELLRRYRLAVTRLGELGQEARSLQEENEWLRLAYEDLNCTLDGLLVSSDPPLPIFSGGGGSNRQLVGMSSTNNNNNIIINNNNDNVAAVIGSNSPTSVITNQEERILLPKSISVPSPGYFKLKKSSPSSTPTTPMTSSNLSTPSSQDVNGIRLRVRRDVDKAIELDVYNQGMYKTELCNKWQQTNTCPYRDHCRFAHGLSELRPVIRHPRYKTQVCRMVLSGTTCPYGHRCHFRHHST